MPGLTRVQHHSIDLTIGELDEVVIHAAGAGLLHLRAIGARVVLDGPPVA
jgi:hypothetical protein